MSKHKTNGNGQIARSNGEMAAKSAPQSLAAEPEDLIRAQMTSVPQVESVFVETLPRGCGFQVFTIVNERDADVRAQIYRRELAIMDEYKNLDFDFRIISRRNRELSEVITGLGETIFSRI